jgi:hypothetical protein
VGTSVAFLKGHRMRVHVTSSHFPQFDRNPNTGAKFGTTREVRVAQQTVYHDADHASHILLPVIRRGKDEDKDDGNGMWRCPGRSCGCRRVADAWANRKNSICSFVADTSSIRVTGSTR